MILPNWLENLSHAFQLIQTIPMQSILEWVASISGLLGAFLLASHSELSKYG